MADADDSARIAALLAGRRRFLAFVEQRVGSRDDAEEILQDAFVRGIEHADDLRHRDDEGVVAWFYRVLRNAVVDRYRQRARDGARYADSFDLLNVPESTGQPQDACKCIEELLPLIHPEYATLIRLVDLGGRSIGAVARERGVSAGSARIRLHRARAALRREVERTCRTCAEHGCLDCTCAHERKR